MRGKHAASAAKRRADSAEVQLDRLMEEVTDLRRKAKQYKSAYDMLPTLQRELRDIKRESGVPLSDVEAMQRTHNEELQALRQEHEKAWLFVLEDLARFVVNNGKCRDELPSPYFARQARKLPTKPVVKILTIMGFTDRYTRRTILDDSYADHKQEAREQILNAAFVNQAIGGETPENHKFVSTSILGWKPK
jgi:hypothetical protein